MKPFVAADLFCGAGGTSTGLVEACRKAGRPVKLTAINHWPTAVATHSLNHPEVRHLCASLDSLNPRELFNPGELDLLWASPECTHHSNARGGKPISEQSRATAWCVIRWADALLPNVVLVENVREFLTWGPLDSKGRPLESRKGELFGAWRAALEALGYRVDFRILCAADFGDPTTRERLFIQAVRGRRPIRWPEPTHCRVGQGASGAEQDLFRKALKPWRAAREIIDWSLPGKSIFKRERPLSPKTMNRIMVGLKRYGLKGFTLSAGGPKCGPTSVDEPLGTVLCRDHRAVAQPYLVKLKGTGTANDVDRPLDTVAANGKHHAIAEPFLVQVNHEGEGGRVRNTAEPLPTVCGNRGEWAVCNPFVLGQQSGAVARQVDQPLPTVATDGAIGLVQPFIVGFDNGGSKSHQTRSVEEPLSTVVTEARHAVAQPFIVKYYGTGQCRPVDEPVDTVTAKERFGLAMPEVEIDGERFRVDIHFRMLQPHELAGAQGFPKDYRFTGNKSEQVKQIGNAVPGNLSEALVAAVL